MAVQGAWELSHPLKLAKKGKVVLGTTKFDRICGFFPPMPSIMALCGKG